MAPSSTRTSWKGAISFGLVHFPVTLQSATAENRMKFNLLDKRTMNPVGNKQVNKSTQTIGIESFIDGARIPTEYYNKPYDVAPASKGEHIMKPLAGEEVRPSVSVKPKPRKKAA